MSIKYKVYENNLNQNCRISAKIIKNNTYVAKDIIERMLVFGSTVTKADIVAVVELFGSTVITMLEEGNRVNLFDIVHIYPVLTGKFDDINEKYDDRKHKVEIRSSAGKKIKNIMFNKNEIVKENMDKPSPVIRNFVDNATESENEIISSENIGVVNGENLKINTSNQDEGLFLINEAGNHIIRVSKFQKNRPKQLVFLIPQLFNDNYRIEIRTRVRGIKELRKSDWKVELKSG